MKEHIIVIPMLLLLGFMLLYIFSTLRMTYNYGIEAPVPRVIWRFLWLPLMIQGLITIATIISILALIRERILR